MDKQKVINILHKAKFSDSKAGTRVGFYDATMNASAFRAEQVNNRSSASWKTAQYIVVEAKDSEEITDILNGWSRLVGNYTNQLLIIVDSLNTATIYNYKGLPVGKDEDLINILGIKDEINTIVGDNQIFYGVPGCGKSYYVEYNVLGKSKDTGEYCKDYEKENVIRTTFHPEYSHSDFIGQIIPKVVNEETSSNYVVYEFMPGPFVHALIQAIKNPKKKVALVIEEINRGNAPSIFGDIFQLLDRNNKGNSEYEIDSIEIIDYLNRYNFGTIESPKYRNFSSIGIPNNLFLFATMNTSDQNVFTLDTAFKRRWEMKCIPNVFTDECVFRNTKLFDTSVTWETFVTHINRKYKDLCAEENSVVSEDMRLGVYFISEKETHDINLFAEKVLMYLWNDAFKYNREKIFATDIKILDELIEEFKSNRRFEVFTIEGIGSGQKLSEEF